MKKIPLVELEPHIDLDNRHARWSNEAKHFNVPTTMLKVSMALIPGIIVLWYWYGNGVWLQILNAGFWACIGESIVLKIRQQPIIPALSDYSALLAGLLLGICLPAQAPWWLGCWGGLTASMLGKQLFGGLGQNPFNPAMLAYLILLLGFPIEMTVWLDPYSGADMQTAATPLDRLNTPGALWPWVSVQLAFLIGGLWLIQQKIIPYALPAGVVIGFLIITALVGLPFTSVILGASCFGAFFIATDPVTSPNTQAAKWLFALGVGGLTAYIRSLEHFPDGFAFAIILMNSLAPWFDQLFQPKPSHFK